jgi:HK97 family phage major capsid protein
MKSALAFEMKDDGGDTLPDAIAQALANLDKRVDGRLTAIETKSADSDKVVDRLAKLEAKLNRPANDNAANDSDNVVRKSFTSYLRRGKEALPEVEHKALSEYKAFRLSTEPGFLAPTEFSTEFIHDVAEYSPIRSVASIKQTGQPSVTLGKRTGITNAKWKGENQPSEASEPTFSQLEVHVREMTTHVDISNMLLADAQADVEGEVRQALAEDFGGKEAAAFVNGDGVLAPRGFMTRDDIAITLNGHATDLKPDALISLLYAVPATYRNRGVWMMNGTTIATIRKLKDGQGNYLWQPSYQAGQPETILSRPVVEAVDMPDVGSGNFPIIYGDFSGYRILDRLDLSVLVNPFLLATNGMTRFHATRRVGGDVIRPNLFRKLKIATS